jgi:cytochrome c peroxidase
MTTEKVELGEALFFDEALSSSGDISCASCHDPDRAFTEDRAVSVAQGGELHTRNSPTLINTAFLASYGWANPVLRTLERHAPVPLFGEFPVEIGLEDEQIAYVAEAYDLDRAFPSRATDLEAIVHALASYQRTLIDFDSRWDRGELDEAEARGEAVFEAKGCVDCHAPPLFTDARELVFHDDGVNSEAEGLMQVTLDEADRGFFKTPTLRNVGITSPYMHDGRFAALEDVIDAYDVARDLELTSAERADLLAFLRAL